ncbi:hypothetical protein SAMN05421819_3091 [Bryocella elongata]|uniref:Uncharacterized protein n=1 Tax=Bryocella elongata TaxID=863522 RepID=A0A1H6ADI6_9BACT|nr:hypothetical protein SAMN05421819_3091 [Bryocella elongata]
MAYPCGNGYGSLWITPYLQTLFNRLPHKKSPFIFAPINEGQLTLNTLILGLLHRSGLSHLQASDLVEWSRNQSLAVRRSTVTT